MRLLLIYHFQPCATQYLDVAFLDSQTSLVHRVYFLQKFCNHPNLSTRIRKNRAVTKMKNSFSHLHGFVIFEKLQRNRMSNLQIPSLAECFKLTFFVVGNQPNNICQVVFKSHNTSNIRKFLELSIKYYT